MWNTQRSSSSSRSMSIKDMSILLYTGLAAREVKMLNVLVLSV